MPKRPTLIELAAERMRSPDAQAGYESARMAHEFGRQVREAREAARMTQGQLAARMGTSQSAVARLEAGGVHPTLTTICRLAKELSVSFVLTAEGAVREIATARSEA